VDEDKVLKIQDKRGIAGKFGKTQLTAQEHRLFHYIELFS
jgi:hypothetical protein